MATSHCPHCGGLLPDTSGVEGAVSFCPSCGRRVEGWKTGFRATIGGAHAEPVVLGLDEPTRALAPGPALLRSAVASQAAVAGDTDVIGVVREDAGPSRPVRKRSGVGGLLLLLGGSVALALTPMVLIQQWKERPVVVGPAVETSVVAPVIPVAAVGPVERPDPEPTKLTTPDPVKPASTRAATKPAAIVVVPVLTSPAKTPKPEPVHKEAPKQPGPTRLAALAPKPGPSTRGGLPHKTGGKTDSRASDVSAQPSGTGSPVVAQQAAPPALVAGPGDEEQPAQTPEEHGREDASRADADNVRFVVQAHLGQVQACYSRAFKESAPPGGRIDVGFVVGKNGRASRVRTESNATRSTMLSGCLEQRIAEWQFPRPASGEFELIYPFVFSPGN